MSAASGMEFWLEYVDHHGGVFERTGDGALVVLPPDLAAQHGQGEEFMVTAEPEVAGEGGATLLTAGHPLLTVAAEAVLTAGDNGRVRLPRPAGRAPAADGLLEQLRGCFPVDHGRIDLTGGPRPAVRQVLRVGAMVTFELSAEDQFQEHLECWVDTEERLTLPPADVAGLVGLLADQHPERSDLVVDSATLRAAVCAADDEIRRRAQARQDTLAQQVDESRATEIARAGQYYREMIGSLVRRRDTAAAGKSAAYQDRINAAQAERDRRLAEIDAKYKGSVTILPFRLQVIGVPVLRVEVDVRRGERRYPLVLDWLAPTRSFAAIRCPHCRSTAGLVAGKARLGCRSCLPKVDAPALRLVTESAGQPPPTGSSAPPKQSVGPTKSAGSAPSVSPTTSAATATPVPPTKSPGPAARKPTAPTPPARKPTATTPAAPQRRPARPASMVPAATASPSMYPELKVTADGRLPLLSPAKINDLERKLLVRFWELVDRREGSIGKILAPASPAAVLVSWYGIAGVRRAVGLAERAPFERVSWSPDSQPDGPGPRVTDGFVEDADGREYRFRICWHLDHGRALIDEITRSARARWPLLPDAIQLAFPAVGGLFELPRGHRPDDEAPALPGVEPDDEVTGLLMNSTLAARGLPLTLRCVTAWWRTAGRAELIRSFGPPVLVAALDRMIVNRAGATQTQYAAAADEHRVGVSELRAASAILQKRLGLSATKPW